MIGTYASGEIRGPFNVVRWVVTADAPAAILGWPPHPAPDSGQEPPAAQIQMHALADLVGAVGVAVTGSVHGSETVIVREPGLVPGCDAIITQRQRLALATLAADCVPVILADPWSGVVAAAHCGWRGLTVGVITNVVLGMITQGARDITAVVGPSICADCYPVPHDRIAAVRSTAPEPVAAASCQDDPPRIGVGAGVIAELSLLREHGIGRIDVVRGCTAEDSRLQSYRRNQTPYRHAMVVGAETVGVSTHA